MHRILSSLLTDEARGFKGLKLQDSIHVPLGVGHRDLQA